MRSYPSEISLAIRPMPFPAAWLVCFLYLMVLLLPPPLTAQPSLTWVRPLAGASDCYIADISADGSIVVGVSGARAFLRLPNGSMHDLGTLGGAFSSASGVSADGEVVVGSALRADSSIHAFRWTSSGGMQDLGTLGGNLSTAFSVSQDGSTVVGYSTTAAGIERAFLWTPDSGMVDLGAMVAGGFSRAWDVSSDGSVVVGVGLSPTHQQFHAFLWTADSGMMDLGTLGGAHSTAYGVSGDGSVVVGGAKDSLARNRAFRWTQSGGMEDLDPQDQFHLGHNHEAYAASEDGSVIVGGWVNMWQAGAFRWTASTGMEDLNQRYASLLSSGSILVVATAITPDGRYIAGNGYNATTGRYEGFILDTAIPTGIKASSPRPGQYILYQNFPNPFNPTTTLRFSVPEESLIRLRVYDLQGRVVATLLEERILPGEHAVEFRAGHLPAGLYFARLEAGQTVRTIKMVLVK